jgi:hypothetical protein
MIDNDEDYSVLHQEDRAKKDIFREDDEPKRKSKAKTKTKKAKSDDSGSDKKGAFALPLSMLPQSDEDRAIFTNKSAAHKASKGVARKYDPKKPERYAQGEVIDHKDFGIGFVVDEMGLNKMEVVFAKGRKLMIQASRKA